MTLTLAIEASQQSGKTFRLALGVTLPLWLVGMVNSLTLLF